MRRTTTRSFRANRPRRREFRADGSLIIPVVVALGFLALAAAVRPIGGSGETSLPRIAEARPYPTERISAVARPAAIQPPPRRAETPATSPIGAVDLRDGTTAVAESAPIPRPAAGDERIATTAPEPVRDETRPAPPDERPAGLAAWSPPTGAPAPHRYSEADAPCLTGSLSFPSTVKGCAMIVCDYVIPHDGTGRPLPSAADVIAVFPYPTEAIAIQSTARVLASRCGFTLFSLRFPSMAKESGDDRKTYYYFPESGSGAAYLTAAERVRAIAAFPKRKLLLTGRSGGGSAAQLFANAYPQEVDGLAEEAARVFPDTIAFRGPMLITHGEHDYVAPKVLAFESELIATKSDYLRVPFHPNWSSRGRYDLWTHGMFDVEPKILYCWLCDVANLRAANGGHLPPCSSWRLEGGQRFPGELSLAAWRTMPPASVSIVASGARASMARPASVTPPRAVVMLLQNGLEESEDEARFDIEQLADRAFLGISASDAQAARAAWTSLGAAERKLPVLVVSYGQRPEDQKLLGSLGTLACGWIVFGRPPTWSKTQAKPSVPVRIAVRDGGAAPSELPDGAQAISYPPGENLGRAHVARVDVITQQAALLVPAPR